MPSMDQLIARATNIPGYPYQVSFDDTSSSPTGYWLCKLCKADTVNISNEEYPHLLSCLLKEQTKVPSKHVWIYVISHATQASNNKDKERFELIKQLALDNFTYKVMQGAAKIDCDEHLLSVWDELKKIASQEKLKKIASQIPEEKINSKNSIEGYFT